MGDEVFALFFANRGRVETPFGTFVDFMTKSYRFPRPSIAPFMTCPTFISCVMSWIINLDIDYRAVDSVCTVCGHNPEALACDGVYVGVSMKYKKPVQIEKAENDDVKPSLHLRYTRTLIKGIHLIS